MIKRLLSIGTIRQYVILVFFLVFLFPSRFILESSGLAVDNYIYGLFSCYLLTQLFRRSTVRRKHFFFIVVVFVLVVAHQQATPLHLLSLIVLDHICINKAYYADSIVPQKSLLRFCFFGLILYSALYFGVLERYAYLGVGEVNISGLGIFLLGVIAIQTNKKLGYLIWILGLLTFSRNYVLALIIYVVVKYYFQKINTYNCNRYIKKLSFFNIGLVSCIILCFVSRLFQLMYEEGLILEYTAGGLNRFMSIFEISNYHRFTVNTNVLEIYAEYPHLLFTGIPIEDFSEYNLNICKLNGYDFANDRPHNFFFSYIQIYGGYSLFIFFFMVRIFKSIVDQYNFHVFLSIMIYGIFLGMGLSGYWLSLSVITLVYVTHANKQQ